MKIAVIGNGAWGSALASLARRRGHPVSVWGRHPRDGECPGLEEALKDAEVILLGVASHAMREVCEKSKAHIPSHAVLVSLAKGIEQDTDLRMSQVIAAATGRREIAAMSGPTFASEVLRGVPSAIVCAAEDEGWAKRIQAALNGDDFRVYTHTDVTGVELGGALKNIMAIAAGVCVGLGLGENTVAALITRGLAELSRIGTALGGQPHTFYGLSGVGDLILTCSSRQSRNRLVGEGLGRGETLQQVLSLLKGTAEGVKTSRSVYQILQRERLEAPILQEIYSVLYEGKPAREAVRALMGREPKSEFAPRVSG